MLLAHFARRAARGFSPTLLSLALLLAASIALVACSNDDKPAAELTDEALLNARYPSELGRDGYFQLKDGAFSERNANSASSTSARLLNVTARGLIDNDKSLDAAVILAVSGGGSGTFMNLVAVLNKDGKPEVAASTLLGDRVVVQAIAIVNHEVQLKVRTHGPQDPACCPSLETTVNYKLEGNQLKETRSTTPPRVVPGAHRSAAGYPAL